MSYSKKGTTNKLISAPTVVSSFVGMTMAVPLALAINAPINASAVQSTAQQATSQMNVDDFARFAHAFNQGYDARTTNATATAASNGSGGSCSTAEVSAGGSGGDQQAVGTLQASTHARPATGGKGGGMMHGNSHKVLDRTHAMVNSFNSYTSMINNTSTVNNTNSNNTVGSHNKSQTDINVEKSKGVMIGVSNDHMTVQENTDDSFNKDSYNTKNDTSIVNDSFNKEVNNTTTTTNTTTDTTTNTDASVVDIDVNKETIINRTEGSYNTDNSGSGNHSGNNLEVQVDANVDVNSHNETNVVTPPAPVVPVILPALEEELPIEA